MALDATPPKLGEMKPPGCAFHSSVIKPLGCATAGGSFQLGYLFPILLCT